MLFLTVLRMALRSLRANKMRSFLTVLGIVIGVASVIAMLALGEGTKQKVTQSVKNFGANLISVRPGQRGGAGGVRNTDQQNLTVEDAEAVLDEVPEIEMVTPDLDESYQVKHLNRNRRISVNGEAVTYFVIRNFPIERGRTFTSAEVNRSAKVAVIGPKSVEDLFGTDDPIGEVIHINGLNFTIVGVTKSKDERSDSNIWIPYTTAMSFLIGHDYLDQIYCRVRDGYDIPTVMEKISEVMRRRHRIQFGRPDDFSVRNYQEIQDSLNQVAMVFTYLLAGIAAVSLLVGGINIMNIMLVTVTERTREIGIRKALGARNLDVLSQFLIEALTISIAGGLIGAAFGVGSVLAFNEITLRMSGSAYGAKIQLLPLVISFSFSVAVGVFFGWYPARKAAKLDPIEALRYE
jgi:putative ABC transport system permease protein